MMTKPTTETTANSRMWINALRLSASTLVLAASVASMGERAWAADATAAEAAASNASDSDQSSSANSLSEVVVTGQRALTKEGVLLEKKDSIAVSSIMSSEEINERPGADIVDVLAHLPGISTFSDMGLGQAATGEAEYITIRGIDSSYNAYTLNGVRVPEADPDSRALSLKLVPPYGIEAVSVTKTPTPDQPGDSIGGVVDIRTPDAFDFGHQMLKITVDGSLAGLASTQGTASAGGGVEVEASRKFGAAENIGVYVAGYYGTSNSIGEAVEALGYLPTLRSQNAPSLLNTAISAESPSQNLSQATGGLSATGLRWDYYNDYIVRYGGNLGVDYRGDNQKLYFKFSFAGYNDTGYDTQHQLIGAVASAYGPIPIAQVQTATYSPSGFLPGSYWQSRNQTEDLATIKIGGETDLGRLTVTYDGSAGYSNIAEPDYVTGSLYGPVDFSSAPIPFIKGSPSTAQLEQAAGLGVASTSADPNFTFNVADPAHPNVTFDSPASAAYALNPAADSLWKYQGNTAGSSNILAGGKIDVHYRVEHGLLDSVQAGIDIDVADRSSFSHPFFTNGPFGFGGGGNDFAILTPKGLLPPGSETTPQGPPASSLPGYNIASFLGGSFPGTFRIYNPATFDAAIIPFAYSSQFASNGAPNPGAYTINDYNGQTVYGTEAVYAGYAEANFKYQDLAATAGFRYEETAFNFNEWEDLTATNGQFQNTSRSYGEILPSALITWRPDPSMVFRADVRESFSRPAYGLLSAPINVQVNPMTEQIIGATEGNPNLKPATAWNYDIAAEFYGQHGDIIEWNAYYKSIENFIYPSSVSGGTPGLASLGSTTTSTLNGIPIDIAENGKNAYLFGMEVDAQHKFAQLPGFLNGFGVGGSLTLQRSLANSGVASVGNTWLPRAPEIIYNLDLLYEKYGVRSDLSYHYTGLQLDAISSTSLNEFLQPQQSLDYSLAYPIHGVTIAFSAKNLLNDVEFYKTLGPTTKYLGTQDGGGNGSYVVTGRFFKLSATYRW
jgi:TonB-dependent receptor